MRAYNTAQLIGFVQACLRAPLLTSESSHADLGVHDWYQAGHTLSTFGIPLFGQPINHWVSQTTMSHAPVMMWAHRVRGQDMASVATPLGGLRDTGRVPLQAAAPQASLLRVATYVSLHFQQHCLTDTCLIFPQKHPTVNAVWFGHVFQLSLVFRRDDGVRHKVDTRSQ